MKSCVFTIEAKLDPYEIVYFVSMMYITSFPISHMKRVVEVCQLDNDTSEDAILQTTSGTPGLFEEMKRLSTFIHQCDLRNRFANKGFGPFVYEIADDMNLERKDLEEYIESLIHQHGAKDVIENRLSPLFLDG